MRIVEQLNGILPERWKQRSVKFSLPSSFLLPSAIVDLICWYYLYRTYRLADHIQNPSFAFDKIEGHFFSTTIQLTLLAFILLTISALIRTTWLLSNQGIKPLHAALLILPILAGLVACFLMYPVGGLDIFPYILKAKLKVVYNANPYIQVPLRVAANDSFYPYDHFPSHTLSYGPLWAMLAIGTFKITSTLSGPDLLLPHVLAFKLQAVLFMTGIAWMLWKNRPGRQGFVSAIFFLGNPLVLFELVANGHNDGMMAFFLLAAILLLQRKRWESLLFFTSSLLIKPFPVILLPLLIIYAIHRKAGTPGKWLIGASVSIIIFLFSWFPFLDSPKILQGILSGLQNANAIKTASVSSILREIMVLLQFSPSTIQVMFVLCAGTTILASGILILRYLQGAPFLRTSAVTYLIFCALITNLLPWYFIFFIAVSAAASSWEDFAPALALTFLGLSFYLVSIWAWYDTGSTTLGVHLIQAAILTLPILTFCAYHLFSRQGTGSLQNPVS